MATVSKKSFWNEVTAKALITVSDVAVEQALVVVYNNQTASEQSSDQTLHANGIGFAGTDAEFGSSLAKQVLQGRILSVGQLKYARRMALKYWGQAARVWNEERAKKRLDTTAPAPKPKAPVVSQRAVADRMAWKPGDLIPLDELFPEEDPLAGTTVQYEQQAVLALGRLDGKSAFRYYAATQKKGVS